MARRAVQHAPPFESCTPLDYNLLESMLKKPAVGFVVLLLLVSSPIHSQEQSPRELFSRAYALSASGQADPAEVLFLRTLERRFVLEDYSLHFVALIAAKHGNVQSPRQYYAALQQRLPDSVWLPHADLQLAKFSLEEKNYARTAEICRGLRALRPKKEIADEAGYLLALA